MFCRLKASRGIAGTPIITDRSAMLVATILPPAITASAPIFRWSLTPTLPPNTTLSPIWTLPAMPTWPQIRQVRPITAL